MRKKKYAVSIMLMFLFALMLCGRPNDVSAATRQTQLKANRTYKNYDITGDKKKDSIRVKTTTYSFALIVNGRTVFSSKANFEGGMVDIRYCQFANGKPFLFVRGYWMNSMTMSRIFYYRNGKLAGINLGNYFGNYASIYGIYQFKIIDNTFSIVFNSMPYSTGVTFLKPYKFAYKNGAIVRTTYAFNVEQFSHTWNSSSGPTQLKAARNLTAYTDSSMKKKAYTIRKGQTVDIKKIYYNGKIMMLRTEYKGKYGWVKALTKSEYMKHPQFSDVQFAG